MYNLKKCREAAGLSQSQLAAASGVPLRSIHAYEAENVSHRDINHAEVMTVYRLAEALGCSIKELLEFEEPEVV